MIQTSTRPSNQLELNIGDIVCNGKDITLDMETCVKTLKTLSICKVTAIDELRGTISVIDTEASPGEPEFVCRNIRLQLASLKDVKGKVAKIRFFQRLSIAFYAAGAVAFFYMIFLLFDPLKISGIFPYAFVISLFFAGRLISFQFSRAEKKLYHEQTRGKL